VLDRSGLRDAYRIGAGHAFFQALLKLVLSSVVWLLVLLRYLRIGTAFLCSLLRQYRLESVLQS